MPERIRINNYKKPITQAEITMFCRRCDWLSLAGKCTRPTVSPCDQARYAATGWCGWPSVNGVDGNMTAIGFFLPLKEISKIS